jgi:hypothetical protein
MASKEELLSLLMQAKMTEGGVGLLIRAGNPLGLRERLRALLQEHSADPAIADLEVKLVELPEGNLMIFPAQARTTLEARLAGPEPSIDPLAPQLLDL